MNLVESADVHSAENLPQETLAWQFTRFLTAGGGTGDESYCEYMR